MSEGITPAVRGVTEEQVRLLPGLGKSITEEETSCCQGQVSLRTR